MNNRQSNIELLRIIAMLFIVVGHVMVHATKRYFDCSPYVEAVTLTGVNIFILISGYFTIKLKVRNFINLYLMVLFYSLSAWWISEMMGIKIHFDLTRTTMLVTHYSYYWFIQYYLLLMLLAPAINTFLRNADTRVYLLTAIVLLYISSFSGWYYDNKLNPAGYSFFQFMLMYVLGNGLKRYNVPRLMKMRWWIMLYLALTAGIALMIIYNVRGARCYNDPLLVASAVAIMCIFCKFYLHSKPINYAATFMLPVYLIQESNPGRWVYSQLYTRGDELHWGAQYIAELYLYVLAVFALAFLIDPIRRLLIALPVNALFSRFPRLDFLHHENSNRQ